EDTAVSIDHEVKRILTEAYDRAMIILKGNLETLHCMASALLEHESLNGKEIDKIMADNGANLPQGV
ncbi:MAG: cell division protease FtsH, partial [Planctomycetota bacterium]